MTAIIETVARVAGGYTEEEWAALVASPDPLDACTVTNFRVIAGRVSGLMNFGIAGAFADAKAKQQSPS